MCALIVIIFVFFLDSLFLIFIDIFMLLVDETSFNLKLSWMGTGRGVQGKEEEERAGVH